MSLQELNSFLPAITFLGQVASFVFLNQQIKSKNKVIADLKTIIDATDIKKIIEYNEYADKLKASILKSEIELQFDAIWREKDAEIGQQYNELATFTAEILSNMPLEMREDFINKNLPHSKAIFTEYFQDDTNNEASDSKENG